ncbi:hypothetical protein CCMA1212_006795, partial [Trichoderma ghanense]
NRTLLRGSLVPFVTRLRPCPSLSKRWIAPPNRLESADASSRTQWTHSPARTRLKKSRLAGVIGLGTVLVCGKTSDNGRAATMGPGRSGMYSRELIDCAFDVGRDAFGGGKGRGTDGLGARSEASAVNARGVEEAAAQRRVQLPDGY